MGTVYLEEPDNVKLGAAGLRVILVYDDQNESMEEKRAMLPQYAAANDANKLKAHLSSIESRLSSFVSR